jgi:ribonuclease BN (tRNA processing enzyme)
MIKCMDIAGRIKKEKIVKIIFLGTNGWFSTPTGNTPCILVDSEQYYIIFDAGEGMYKLDNYISQDKPIYLFLSHFHLDHIYGFHFINKFRFIQGIAVYGQKGTGKFLNRIVARPYTTPIKEVPTRLTIHELSEGSHKLPFPVTCKFLVHADPCMGYRIAVENKVVTYCKDTGICDNSLYLAKDADILIHECASKPGEYIKGGRIPILRRRRSWPERQM